MRCSSAKKLISGYIDDNLETKRRLLLERHLKICSDCEKLMAELRGIIKEAKGLETLSPSKNSWQRIKEKLQGDEQKVLAFHAQKRSRIKTPFYQSKIRYALVSALLLVLILGTVTIMLLNWREKGVSRKEFPVKYALTKLDEAEQHYQNAIKALWEAASALKGEMDPQVANIFKKNLEIIDSSITACRRTVLEEPDNIEVKNYLLAAYMGKVDFLYRMLEVKKASSREREMKTTI